MKCHFLFIGLFFSIILTSCGNFFCYQTLYKNHDEISYDIGNECTFLQLRDGEKMVSIGASTGYFEIACGVLYNKPIEFYIEDIDTNCTCNPKIEAVIQYYKEEQGIDFHGHFTPVIGNETGTTLPSSSMDLVLCRISFHHFPDPKMMLKEFDRILKPDGNLIIAENLVTETGILDRYCKTALYAQKDLVNLIEANGYQLVDSLWANKAFIETRKHWKPNKDTPYKLFKFAKKS